MKKTIHDLLGMRKQNPAGALEIDYTQPHLNNGAFVIGSGKSGTTLLQALFDSHPKVVVLPVESGYYLQYPKLASDLSSNRVQKLFLAHWLEKSKFSWMAEGVFKKHSVEEGRDFTSVDFAVFRAVVEAYEFRSHTRARFFQTLVDAYRQSIEQDSKDTVQFIEKTPAHLFHVDDIRQDFPQARFIHILRDPYDNYYAYRTNALSENPARSSSDLLNAYVERYIAPSFENASLRAGQDNYKIIRYEDLVKDTENVMRSLAGWLQIPYCDELRSVTLCGKPWTGNSSSRKRFNDVDTGRLGQGTLNLSDEEKQYIHNRIAKLAKSFNYN